MRVCVDWLRLAKKYYDERARNIVSVNISMCCAAIMKNDCPHITMILNMLQPKHIIDLPNCQFMTKPSILLLHVCYVCFLVLFKRIRKYSGGFDLMTRVSRKLLSYSPLHIIRVIQYFGFICLHPFTLLRCALSM